MRIVCFLLILAVLPRSASALSEDLMLSSYWDFYSDNRFSIEATGRGNAGIADKGGLFAAILNPASLDLSQGLQVAAGYSYKTKQPWLTGLWPDIGEIYLKTLQPCLLFGINYSIADEIQAGLVYYDAKSYKMDYGASVWVDENEEASEPIDDYENIRISSLYVPFKAKINDALSFGLGVYINQNSRYIHFFRDYRCTFYSFSFQPGLLIGPINGLSVGLIYRPGGETKYSDGYVDLVHKASAFLGLGLKLESPEMRTSFYFDFNRYGYSDIDSGLRDRLDTGLGIEQGLGKFKLRTGYFSIMDYRRSGNSLLTVGNDDQHFLTGGTSFPVGPVEVTLSLMDSRLLSPGDHKMTQVSCGLNYRITK
jgi:hypothetical protein